jgi:hypothetical protein
LTLSFDDPHFEPPADIQGADARAYEEKILQMLRDVLGDRTEIELRGERPNTEIIFHITDGREPGPNALRFALWTSEYPFRGPEADDLYGPASVAGWIYSDWLAGDLEPMTEPSD